MGAAFTKVLPYLTLVERGEATTEANLKKAKIAYILSLRNPSNTTNENYKTLALTNLSKQNVLINLKAGAKFIHQARSNRQNVAVIIEPDNTDGATFISAYFLLLTGLPVKYVQDAVRKTREKLELNSQFDSDLEALRESGSAIALRDELFKGCNNYPNDLLTDDVKKIYQLANLSTPTANEIKLEQVRPSYDRQKSASIVGGSELFASAIRKFSLSNKIDILSDNETTLTNLSDTTLPYTIIDGSKSGEDSKNIKISDMIATNVDHTKSSTTTTTNTTSTTITTTSTSKTNEIDKTIKTNDIAYNNVDYVINSGNENKSQSYNDSSKDHPSKTTLEHSDGHYDSTKDHYEKTTFEHSGGHYESSKDHHSKTTLEHSGGHYESSKNHYDKTILEQSESQYRSDVTNYENKHNSFDINANKSYQIYNENKFNGTMKTYDQSDLEVSKKRSIKIYYALTPESNEPDPVDEFLQNTSEQLRDQQKKRVIITYALSKCDCE